MEEGDSSDAKKGGQTQEEDGRLVDLINLERIWSRSDPPDLNAAGVPKSTSHMG